MSSKDIIIHNLERNIEDRKEEIERHKGFIKETEGVIVGLRIAINLVTDLAEEEEEEEEKND